MNVDKERGHMVMRVTDVGRDEHLRHLPSPSTFCSDITRFRTDTKLDIVEITDEDDYCGEVWW